jgi:soluble lytic murein transglycosylase-like protein
MKPTLSLTLLIALLWCGPAAAVSPEVVQGRSVDGTKNATPPVDPELRALLKQAAAETGSFTDRFDAEVWLMDMSQRLAKKVPDAKFRVELLKSVHREATRTGLKPELVLAVIEVESNFDRFAISRAGARGLMQVMPFWLKEIGRPGDSLIDLHTNLRYGCTILKYYLDKERGNLRAALARYNGSQGQGWYPARVNLAYQKRWFPQ